MARMCLLITLLVVPCSPAQESAPPVQLHESWQAAYFEGLKVGHTHTLVTQTGKGEEARIRTTQKMDLVIKRYGSVQEIKLEQVCEETTKGRVLALGVTLQQGTDMARTMKGVVEDGMLNLGTVKIPFDEKSLGLYAQQRIYHDKKSKPGDKVSFTTFEILVGRALVVNSVLKDIETTDKLELQKKDGKEIIARVPVKLLRVEATPEPFSLGSNTIQLPTTILWLDSRMQPVRQQTEMPGLGTITYYHTTKEAASKDGVAPDRLPDFGLNVTIPCKQTLEDPYRTKEVTYKVTFKGKKLDKVFSTDERQSIRNVTDSGFDLVVKAVREPGTRPADADKEYLESNLFIDSNDERIQALARAVTLKETDPWKKAQALERWVYENMKVSTAVGFPSASQIAKDREGDCRQHAVFLAALCRAVGIPSRTALGLVYARQPGRSPVFGFHMWTEVWVKGRWVGLDAIGGLGGIGATHLKISDHSWSKTQTLAPFLPILQTLGQLNIEVVEAK